MGEMTSQEIDDLAYLTQKYGGTFRKVTPRPLGVVLPDGSIGVRFIPIKDGLVVSEHDKPDRVWAECAANETANS
ncbi:hypothetical protein GB928_004195 [Shinella curvata]|uniref:Uncharacterized protein n=1 Tax=Shinella curvata TaxID=1817964 RepID=A0ABT8X9M8_9HYPH|nr:hypothetical protein [Shinella curvata]MCJ8051677.1 hypothetical protein [Shinella curvata]MDO6120376.1 hypothetical protein [Shinella curvata]